MKAKKTIKVKPSRLRYEQAHPTVSFRIARTTFERLKATIGTLGYSFGDWVKAHLDQDDRGAQSIAQQLAQQRDGLGREVEKRRRELFELDRRLQERNREVSASVEQEKARRLKELDQWYAAEKAYRERLLASAQMRVDEIHGELAKEQEKLRALQLEVATQEGRKAGLEKANKALDERRDQWRKEMEEATNLINRYPWLFCQQCPGSAMARSMMDLVNKIASPSPQKTSPLPNTAPSQGSASISQSAGQVSPQVKPPAAASGVASEAGKSTGS